MESMATEVKGKQQARKTQKQMRMSLTVEIFFWFFLLVFLHKFVLEGVVFVSFFCYFVELGSRFRIWDWDLNSYWYHKIYWGLYLTAYCCCLNLFRENKKWSHEYSKGSFWVSTWKIIEHYLTIIHCLYNIRYSYKNELTPHSNQLNNSINQRNSTSIEYMNKIACSTVDQLYTPAHCKLYFSKLL